MNNTAVRRAGKLIGGLSNVGWTPMRSMATRIGSDVSQDAVQKSVYISQSTDIYTNLALEDWFYRNNDFTNHHVLLLWRNKPCVVVGRHQNPWLEADLKKAATNDIAVARRNSGGGTVYHDMGNLNLSFFAPRERYDRKYNLDIICRALYRQWGLKVDVNEREDIVIDGEFKVSGTAAKLGRPNSYHHCTLLVNVNGADLSSVLRNNETGITTNATESTRSMVKNLTDVNGHVYPESLLTAIGWEYLRTRAFTLDDGGESLVQRQKGFQMINPTEDWFPGITELRDEFASWEWTYGKTPKFTVTRQLEFSGVHAQVHELTLTLDVQSGIVEDIKISLPTSMVSNNIREDASIVTSLKGARYSEDLVTEVAKTFGCTTIRKMPRAKSNIALS